MLVAAFTSPPPTSSSFISILNAPSTVIMISITSNALAGFSSFERGVLMSTLSGVNFNCFATILWIVFAMSAFSFADEPPAVGTETGDVDGTAREFCWAAGTEKEDEEG